MDDLANTIKMDDNLTWTEDATKTIQNRSEITWEATQQAKRPELDRTLEYKFEYSYKVDPLQPSEAWLRALVALDACDYEEAYKVVLDSGDDLFLLRLMYKTGPDCYRLLKDNTSLRLFSRVVAIAKSQFLNDTILDFFFEACDTGMASQLDKETIESMIIVLECIEPNVKDKQLMGILMDYLKNVRTMNFKAY